MELLGLDWHAWLTVVLVIGMFVALIKTKIPADVIFLVIIALLLVTGCLPTAEALSGFSSSTVVVVGALFVVVAGLQASGVLNWLVKYMLGVPSSYGWAIVRLMLPVASLSAFLHNTSVVALFINVVKLWATKLNMPASKFLIPLSYATGLGGVCTLLGTTPNLVIAGFYAEETGDTLGMFAPLLVGVTCLLVGAVSIIAMQKLIPVRKSPEEELTQGLNSTVHYLIVPQDSHLIGQTLGDVAMMDAIKDFTLVGIVHYDGLVEHIDQMSRQEADDVFLMGSDTLIMTGDPGAIATFGKRFGMSKSLTQNDDKPKSGWYTIVASVIMLGMVLLPAFNIMPLLNAAFIAALLMLVTRCCSVKQAQNSINWKVVMVFAGSITLGKAIDHTGIAQIIVNSLASLCDGHVLLAFIIMCLTAAVLTEFVSNTACSAILAPVAIKLAVTMGANPLTFSIGLISCVSSCFVTPIGSPTNLIVFTPGGYRITDFIRIGLPLKVIIFITCIIVTMLQYPL